MTYRGRIQNGVVVFEKAPPLREGTVVRVEEEAMTQVARGSKEALLRWRTKWSGSPDELGRLLNEVQRMREADLTTERS